ncbi:MAG: hypothetical protein ACREIJ_01355, partial [Nitrospiraceae bacterium]
MSAVAPVTDFLSNLHDQIANAARLMIRAKQRQSVFEAIYKGQQQEKSVQAIMVATNLTQIRVLNEAKKLGPLVEKVKRGFRKKQELASHYKKILSLARDKEKLEKVHTKVSPKIQRNGVRGGPGCLDRMFQFLSGASRYSAYAAVRRVGRLSTYTPFGVCP